MSKNPFLDFWICTRNSEDQAPKVTVSHSKGKSQYVKKEGENCSSIKYIEQYAGYQVNFSEGIKAGTTIEAKPSSLLPSKIAEWFHGGSIFKTHVLSDINSPVTMEVAIQDGRIPMRKDGECYLKQEATGTLGNSTFMIYGECSSRPFRDHAAADLNSGLLSDNIPFDPMTERNEGFGKMTGLVQTYDAEF